MSAATDLYDLAVEYRDACVAAVATSPGGPINRYFVSPGPPAWDCCPQLSVHVGGPRVGDTFPLQPMLEPAHRATVQGSVYMVLLTATVIRCSPTLDNEGTFPSVAELDDASQDTNGDLWSVWNYVKTHKANGTLFGPKEREFLFDPAVPLNQQGGCCGWQIPIQVQLSGYRTA